MPLIVISNHRHESHSYSFNTFTYMYVAIHECACTCVYAVVVVVVVELIFTSTYSPQVIIKIGLIKPWLLVFWGVKCCHLVAREQCRSVYNSCIFCVKLSKDIYLIHYPNVLSRFVNEADVASFISRWPLWIPLCLDSTPHNISKSKTFRYWAKILKVTEMTYWNDAVWASYQIRKIADCACAGNAGNVFPATDFKWNH